MPKEQLCFRENGSCAPSSKNAKDKSNSNTLLTIRDPKHAVDSNRRGSSCTTTLKRNQLHVNNSMRISNHAVSPHMISLDQPSFVPASTQLIKPFKSQTSRVTGNKIKNTYLPILNSYPRIAPHPTKKPPDKSLSNQESQYLSKRICTERKTEDKSVTTSPSEEHHHNQSTVSNSVLLSTLSSRNSLSSSTFTISPTNPGSQSISSLHAASSHHSDGGRQRKITSPHHRRFFNTVELLRQSGLLDITLRTKELLRQSNSTEQDISQLRQHTELLCQAVSNPRYPLSNMFLSGLSASIGDVNLQKVI
uniref:CLOCK-interacting pacemaker b n=1 Tax=Poecilia reticulata TaxID=8081 RepID=A0A3P9NFI0_POERE